jgi:hypothetical protein
MATDKFSRARLDSVIDMRHPLAILATRTPPGLCAADKASKEAQKVREQAYAHSRTDPGFAADLYAAAARHEGLHG